MSFTGIQWYNSYISPMAGDTASFGWMCWLMLIDSLLYFFIGIYIRMVFPGKPCPDSVNERVFDSLPRLTSVLVQYIYIFHFSCEISQTRSCRNCLLSSSFSSHHWTRTVILSHLILFGAAAVMKNMAQPIIIMGPELFKNFFQWC